MRPAPMDEQRYSVRPFTFDDFEEYTVMHNRITPHHPIAVDVFRREWESLEHSSEPPFRLAVVERSNGAMVGSAGLLRNPREDDASRPWIFGEVDRAHNRRGIGAYLYERVRVEALRRGAGGVRCHCRLEVPSDFAFLERRGFVERRRSWLSELEVAHARTEGAAEAEQRLLASGIEFTTLALEGADSEKVQRRLFDLDTAASADVPRIGSYTPISFDEFRQVELTGSGFRPESWMIAKSGAEYIGLSYGWHNELAPTLLEQSLTATRREYRGRGIAQVLKVRLIEFARTHGYERIITSNDSLNLPMWRLNERLGFRKTSVRIQAECVFPPTA